MMFRGANWRTETIRLIFYDEKGKKRVNFREKVFLDVYEQDFGKTGDIKIVWTSDRTNKLWDEETFKQFQTMLYDRWDA